MIEILIILATLLLIGTAVIFFSSTPSNKVSQLQKKEPFDSTLFEVELSL